MITCTKCSYHINEYSYVNYNIRQYIVDWIVMGAGVFQLCKSCWIA